MKRKIAAAILKPVLSLIPAKKGTVVLTLHNIGIKDFQWFERFIQFISDYYEFIDPHNIDKEFLISSRKPKILLTFDDGFYSNKILAEKVLQKYDIKSIFFLTEDFIGLEKEEILPFIKKTFYPSSSLDISDLDGYSAMSWKDVNWLSKNGHMIGAHTKSHPFLSKIEDKDQLLNEIIFSADRMEEKIDAKINCFAFPFGSAISINNDIIYMAKKRFDFLFSNVRGNVLESPGRGFIFRQNIVPKDPIWLIRMMIDGQLDWIYSRTRNDAKNRFAD